MARSCAAAVLLFIALAAIAAFMLNPRLTRYVESDAFRQALENETAKGLHFRGGIYAPIHRTGLMTARSERFRADDGQKAMRSIDAREITARFNPWAIFLRRWQFDDIRIGSGDVEVQTYEPASEPVPAKPWFSIFLPNRVYLKRIESDAANVTWQFRAQRAGFFGTRLLITAHGRDFNYQATGGTLKMPLFPDLYLRQMHLLITKKLFTLYDVDLATAAVPVGEAVTQNEGNIHGHGTAGVGEDKSVDLDVSFERVPIEAWLPSNWKEHLTGTAFGKARWTGKDAKLESSSGEGSLGVRDARITGFPFLENLAIITGEKSFQHLELNDCALELEWRYPKIDIGRIALEEKGKFRIEGALAIDRGTLSGAIELGVARQYLNWLPKPDEIFTREQGGYLWTTVHLSGTTEAPKEDLSPRVVDLLKQSPAAFLGFLFRQLSAWLKQMSE